MISKGTITGIREEHGRLKIEISFTLNTQMRLVTIGTHAILNVKDEDI